MLERFIIKEMDKITGKWLLAEGYLESEPSFKVSGINEPLFAGARLLLDQGYDPRTLLTTRYNSKSFDNWVPATIEKLSKLSIVENDTGMRLIKYKKHPGKEIFNEG